MAMLSALICRQRRSRMSKQQQIPAGAPAADPRRNRNDAIESELVAHTESAAEQADDRSP